MSAPRALIVARPGIGGAAGVVEALLRRLPERGVTGTAALSTLESDRLLGVAQEHGWRTETLDLRREISLFDDGRAAFRLRRLMAEHDVVHAHAAKAGALARVAVSLGRRLDTPVVYAPHGFYFTYHDEDSPAWRRYLGLERRLASRTTLLHCVSEAERRIAIRYGLAAEDTSVALPNPIPARPSGRPRVTRADLGVAEDARLVVMAARLEHPKDPVTFVRAARHVAADRAAAFVLVGEGALADAARAAVADDDDGEERTQVAFAPADSDVRGLLGDADVAVLCSRSEALPLFLLEALAEGVPIVASDLDGCRDAAGDAAEYAPAGDERAVGAAIDRLLADAELHARRSTAATARAALFDEDAWLDGVLDLYGRVTAPAGS